MNLSSFGKIRVFFLGLVGLALLGSVASAVFYYRKYQTSLKSQKALTEIEEIVRKVSRLMELPAGETPTLATVSDKRQLQNQNFFQKAENGDRILVYSQAKRAILYRPSIDKIIDLAPITPLEEVAGEATQSGAESSKVAKIAIYNGSGVAGLASLAEEKLKQNNFLASRIEVTIKEFTQSRYNEVLVIDLKGNQQSICQEIAKILSGRITSLPAGEKAPASDILVILGKQ